MILPDKFPSAQGVREGEIDGFEDHGESGFEVGDEGFFFDVGAGAKGVAVEKYVSQHSAAFHSTEEIGTVFQGTVIGSGRKFVGDVVAETDGGTAVEPDGDVPDAGAEVRDEVGGP